MSTIIDKRVAASHDDAARFTPTWWSNTLAYLQMDYDNKDYSVWLRFAGVAIPQGAMITKAYLTVTQYQGFTGAACVDEIYGLDEDDVGDFPDVATSEGYGLTAAQVTWDCTGCGNWAADSEHDSPDIKSIVQEIINRQNWASNHIGFKWVVTTITGGSRLVYSRDGDINKAINLHVEWEQPRPIAVGTNLIF